MITPLVNFTATETFTATFTNIRRMLPGLIAVSLFGSTIFADQFPAAEGDIEITPIVHSSVQLTYQGTVIQVDPWGVLGTDIMQAADLIIVTDSPGHHLDAEAIAALRNPGSSVVTPNNGLPALPDAIAMEIGDIARIASVTVEAIAAYDIIPGAPEHPYGDANGYVLTIGGKRLFFAGVTECVDEVKSLEDIDVAFMPMNIPPARMTPEAAAECTRIIDPEVVYTYHYDQDWSRRLANPDIEGRELPNGLTVAQTLDAFEAALAGSGIEFRRGNWYPE